MSAPTVIAEYHGTCTDCEQQIIPGQAIVADPDNYGWRHDTCGARPDTAPCVCARCFLVHAPNQGEC
jgi:hypothetical protein